MPTTVTIFWKSQNSSRNCARALSWFRVVVYLRLEGRWLPAPCRFFIAGWAIQCSRCWSASGFARRSTTCTAACAASPIDSTTGSILFLGLAVLCRPIGLLLPFVLSVPILLLLERRRAVLHALVLIGVALLDVMPWSIRSSRVAGRFVMVQDSGVAASLFYVTTRLDWDQKDQAVLWPRFVEETRRMVTAAETRHQINAQEEVRVDRLLLIEGIRNIRANPGRYLVSRVRSFPYLFITSYDSATGINQSFGTLAAQRDLLPLAAKLVL